MPPSKTAALEKRIEKLERELAAYKHQLNIGNIEAASTLRNVHQRLLDLRRSVRGFLYQLEEMKFDVTTLPPTIAAAVRVMRDTADDTDPDMRKTNPPTPRKPSP